MLALTIGLIIGLIPSGRAQSSQAPCCDKRGQLIVHIEHDGLSFSIHMDSTDSRFLLISIPRETEDLGPSSLPPVHLKVFTMEKARKVGDVIMRDTDPPIEGQAELVPGAISNGGWVDFHYRFDLRKPTVLEDIHSVTISIGDQTYTAFPY
jgi:hypothetical protein